jgi:hypothetical protein
MSFDRRIASLFVECDRARKNAQDQRIGPACRASARPNAAACDTVKMPRFVRPDSQRIC